MERGNILLKLGKIDEAMEDYESLVCTNMQYNDIYKLIPHRQQMAIKRARNN